MRLHHRITLACLGSLLLAAVPAAAQGPGRITGRVVDAETGRPLSGAQLSVVGIPAGAVSASDGRYTLPGVPAGTHFVRASLIGYAEKTVTGVVVAPGATATLDLSLSAAAVALEGITVSAVAERGSVNRVLDEQRTAVNVTSGISAEEISRGPDDDAAEAVQRVSGVTVEGGRYVFVRGLGERYTTTQLNGARLPSPEPDRRRVPLDLFPAGALEGITVSKTFTPDQSGDFSGAQVNLRTRSSGSEPFTSLSLSLGYNDATTFGKVPMAPATGLDWIGFGATRRAMPSPLTGGSPMGSQQQATVLGAFRNAWTPTVSDAHPNLSLSAASGASREIAGHEVQVLGALSYQNRTEAQMDETRATPVLRGTETVPLNEYTADTGRRSILWGGVLNLATRVGDATRLELNNSYDRSADNEALRLRGFDEELATDLDITRLQYVERSVLSSQLRAHHDLSERRALEWSGTFSRVTRDEPDRSELVYAREADPSTGAPVWAFFGSGTAPTTRAFSALAEQSAAAQADYTVRIGSDLSGSIKTGVLFRYTGRDSDSESFDFDNVGLSVTERALPAEEIFGGRFYGGDALGIRLRRNTFGGSYTASELLGAAYAMVDYPLSGRLNAVAGARLESARIDVDAVDILGEQVPAELRDHDLLPALALNLRLSEAQNLRFAASRTLSRPEYRELADITYRDYVGSFLVFGYPELKRALIDNLDLRWEMYPTGGEVVSAALFAKRFRNPIERVVIPATGAPVLSFRNADRAFNYGLELELRRRLGFVHESLDALTATANATLVRSEVDFGSTDAAASATSQSRALLGQAPYVVNLGVTYTAPSDASATLLFNAVGERITEVGLGGIPDAYERPRSTLDFSLELPVRGGSRLRLEAENILDSESEITQGAVTRMRYRTGRSVSLGVSLRP